MQVLWNRVAQTRSCACSSCVNYAASALTRRVLPTSIANRLQTPEAFFTFCSAATLATAAVLDVASKQNRRSQWDKAIRELKGEENEVAGETFEAWKQDTTGRQEEGSPRVRIVMQDMADKQDKLAPQDQTSRKEDLDAAQQQKRRSDWDQVIQQAKELEQPLADGESFMDIPLFTRIVRPHTINTVRTTSACWDGTKWSSTPSLYNSIMREQLHRLRHFVHNSVSKIEWIDEPGKLSICKKTVTSAETGLSLDYETRYAERNYKNDIQLGQRQRHIAKFVSKLMCACKSMKPIQHDTEAYADLRAELAAKIQDLSTMDVIPCYDFLGPEEMESKLRPLNMALFSIFDSPEVGPDLMVAKICYNLLIWPIPPSITSFNILILHFTKLGLGHLSQIVVEHLLDKDNRLRADEVTAAAMIRHYVSRNDQDGFLYLIKRMQGVQGRDLMIRHRHFNELHKPYNARWALNAPVAQRKEHLHGRAPRDRTVFEEIILGTIMMSRIGKAYSFVNQMLAEGFSLSTSLLHALVGMVIKRNIISEAKLLLHIIVRTWNLDELSGGRNRKLPTSADARLLIHALASFCGVKLSTVIPWEIVKISAEVLFPFDEEALRRMARGLALESIVENLSRLEVRTYGIRNRLYWTSRGTLRNNANPASQTSEQTLLGRLENTSIFLSHVLEHERMERDLTYWMNKDALRLRIRAYHQVVQDHGRKEVIYDVRSSSQWWTKNRKKGTVMLRIVPGHGKRPDDMYRLPGAHLDLKAARRATTVVKEPEIIRPTLRSEDGSMNQGRVRPLGPHPEMPSETSPTIHASSIISPKHVGSTRYEHHRADKYLNAENPEEERSALRASGVS